MKPNKAAGNKPTGSIDPAMADTALGICASFNLRKASRALTQMFDEALQPAGLRSTQLTMLLVLAKRGPTSMSRLARELVLNPSTLSRNLKPLERDGLIVIESNMGRGKTVTLTRRGEKIIEASVPLWTEVQTRFTEQVGERNWNLLLPRLNTLVETVRGKIS